MAFCLGRRTMTLNVADKSQSAIGYSHFRRLFVQWVVREGESNPHGIATGGF